MAEQVVTSFATVNEHELAHRPACRIHELLIHDMVIVKQSDVRCEARLLSPSRFSKCSDQIAMKIPQRRIAPVIQQYARPIACLVGEAFHAIKTHVKRRHGCGRFRRGHADGPDEGFRHLRKISAKVQGDVKMIRGPRFSSQPMLIAYLLCELADLRGGLGVGEERQKETMHLLRLFGHPGQGKLFGHELERGKGMIRELGHNSTRPLGPLSATRTVIATSR